MGERFKAKDCAGAFKEMAEQMEQLESEVFSRELRKLTMADATACVMAVTDEARRLGEAAAEALSGPERERVTKRVEALCTLLSQDPERVDEGQVDWLGGSA